MTSSSKKDIPTLILASGSPRRRELLAYTGLPYTVQPSSVSEEVEANTEPNKLVQIIADRKARDIARRHASAIVIGADTIVVHDNTILGKPESPKDAFAMLRRLSDGSHRVLTGISLLKTDEHTTIIKESLFTETTEVHVGTPTDDEINRYIATKSPMDKAGAYGIQDSWGALFVQRIEGDYYNIVGLPLHILYKQLKNFSPELIKS